MAIEILSHTKAADAGVGQQLSCETFNYPRIQQGPQAHENNIFQQTITSNKFSTKHLLLLLFPNYPKKITSVKQNFLKDCFIFNSGYIYPFAGIFVMLVNPIFWQHIVVFLFCQVITLFIVGNILYFISMPIVLPIYLILFGPIGIILAYLHWGIQTIMMTNFVIKRLLLSTIHDQIFKLTIQLKDKNYSANPQRQRQRPSKDAKISLNDLQWVEYYISWFCKYARKFMVNFLLSSISIVPVLGPILVNQAGSLNRTSGYLKFHINTIKNFNKDQAALYKYENFSKFLTFGMTAGILELLPIFSILTMIGNTIGAALLSLDI
ncbi:hypothetical protein KAFR_0D01210 [Kazachstania africana CBS 2517]|uniref:Outer spore wall protein RRT8 n=1 Tax=Kazachstania africana (strain ATCC 22294 / BCRC 22015 / CBS 2517 / CECT 1963 / NBRC 1671 / NRRL Y-8276) TaxID=1071382 RepID=H2ATR7_KAZAF|nr:hypothetical protein KAFR_0D01210 [Kazachstania africana CBS 2517]CCF57767.1 hypothetical protein KAFR_0D01210 [Kazachstania africana CBS 2517]